jgi:hypothetical protein
MQFEIQDQQRSQGSTMLSIRASQMEKLTSYCMDRYKAELCRHLAQYDSASCEAAGAEAIESVVNSGIRKARECGFTLDGPVRTYLEIMLALGMEFDRDPQYFWLSPWLRSSGNYQEMDRARYLQFHVIRYLDDVQGIDGSYGAAALKRAQQITRGQLAEIGRDDPEITVSRLESIHPLKCRFMGRNALLQLVRSAEKEAGQARLPDSAGACLVLLLMFTYGIGVLRDPMVSWAGRALAAGDETGEDPPEEGRLKRLLEQFQTCQP